MLDHISFAVNNYQNSCKFYDTTLIILGIKRLMNFNTEDFNTEDFNTEECNVAGYGSNDKPFFWISENANSDMQEFVGKARGFHIAFQASSREDVQAWHQKCLELGAKDNGLPGLREEYHPGYYAAYIIDPNGYRLEAVCYEHQEEI